MTDRIALVLGATGGVGGNRRLVQLLGTEPHTPLPEAMRVTLRKSGSL